VENSLKNETTESLLYKLYEHLRQTRKNVRDAFNKNEEYLEMLSPARANIEPIFEKFGKDIENGILPPLPELTVIIHSFQNSESITTPFFYFEKGLIYRRDYLRYLFEAYDYSGQCDCLILARIWPVNVSPQRDRLREIYRKDDDIYDTYTDYVCEVCGSKWRLEDTSTESVSDSCWRLQQLSQDVILPVYDKYGKALAETRSQVPLSLDDLRTCFLKEIRDK
jgi:hypothetical protein